jgi:hypothetical protein
MIIRRETLNEISSWKAFFNPSVYEKNENLVNKLIADAMGYAASDVADAIKAFKL